MGDEYPSPKQALLGNGHVANLYCAIKYVTWQGIFALFTLVIVPLTLTFRVADSLGLIDLLAAVFGGISDRIAESRAFKAYDEHAGYICVFVLGLWVGGVAVAEPMFLLVVAATVVSLVVAIAASIVVFDALAGRLGRAKEASAEKPVVRRIVGHCPVSFTMAPKWFDNLHERLL